MAAHAAELLEPGTRALTHCNAGGLATGGYGTAVGALQAAWERRLLAHVFVDETRPLLQGARLTAWELSSAGIPNTVIVDSAAASLMAAGEVDAVLTGADRIAANGDTANKIGTYSLAVLARHHGIPFYVVAPTSTVDPATATGAGIPIEERAGDEVTSALRGPQPGLRRHAGGADLGDRDRAGRAPRAVRGVAAAAGGRVKAIILAAGYATRLRPLTDTVAKPLLPVGGRPMVDWIVDRIAEVDEVDEVHVVTNARYAPSFRAWAAAAARRCRRRARRRHDLERRPARRDRRHPLHASRRRARRRRPARDRRRQPLPVLARGLRRLVARQGRRERRSPSTTSATLELARKYGIVELGEDDRVVGFVEKPEDPPSTLAATASYLYHREHVPLVARYLDEGNQPDQPGRLIAWLHTREPVYGFVFGGRVARHRRPRAAARGGQPDAAPQRPA